MKISSFQQRYFPCYNKIIKIDVVEVSLRKILPSIFSHVSKNYGGDRETKPPNTFYGRFIGFCCMKFSVKVVFSKKFLRNSKKKIKIYIRERNKRRFDGRSEAINGKKK